MNIEQIKGKYKHIVDSNYSQNQSENSDVEWEQACIKINKKRSSVLTQSQFVNMPLSRVSKQQLLNLKQKLAQCITTITRKDKQINDIKQQLVKSQQLTKFHQRQIEQLRQIIDQKNNNLVEQKAAHKSMEENFKICEQNVEVQILDKQLQNRQINYYKGQIQNLNSTITNYNKKIKEMQVQMKIIKQLKKQNGRLKQDIQRLKDLLSETEKYKKFATQIQYKHYIKKSSTQKQNWVSENLINNVDFFLKKHKIGSGNKEYAKALVKFVDRFSKSVSQQAQKKVQKNGGSRIKQIQSRHNYSLNHSDRHESSLVNKSLKYKDKIKKKHIRTITQSSICSKFQFGSPVFSKSVSIKDLCIRILNQMKQKLQKQLSLKQINHERMRIIVIWAIQSISECFSKQKNLCKTMKVNTINCDSKNQF